MEDKILTPEEAGEAAIQYVKNNVNEIIKKWAGDDGFGKEAKPVLVFMAGSPGAGKTEISKNLLDVLGSDAIDNIKQKVVRIDTDEILYKGTSAAFSGGGFTGC